VPIPHHTNTGNAMPSHHWQWVENQCWPERDENGPHARSIKAEATERTPVRVKLLFDRDGWVVMDGEVRRRANGCVYVHVNDRRVRNWACWVSEQHVQER
jgi:hypothetical protein